MGTRSRVGGRGELTTDYGKSQARLWLCNCSAVSRSHRRRRCLFQMGSSVVAAAAAIRIGRRTDGTHSGCWTSQWRFDPDSSPAGKTVLIDAGDTTKGKAVVEALKRHNVQQIDYFIATHPHPDHIGGAAEVFKGVKVLNMIDNGQEPSIPPELAPPPKTPASAKKPARACAKAKDGQANGVDHEVLRRLQSGIVCERRKIRAGATR